MKMKLVLGSSGDDNSLGVVVMMLVMKVIMITWRTDGEKGCGSCNIASATRYYQHSTTGNDGGRKKGRVLSTVLDDGRGGKNSWCTYNCEGNGIISGQHGGGGGVEQQTLL